MKVGLLILGFVFIGCKQPYLQVVIYEDALENCQYKIEKIKELYPNNELISVGPDCLEGALLPDIEMVDMGGNIITMKSLKGKKNVFNFWFIGCPPCIREMPWLNRLKEELGDKDINYLAISRDSRPDIEEFLLEKDFKYLIVPDGKDLIEKKFGHIWGYPFTIITDENLIITHVLRVKSTEEDFRAEIMPFLID